MKFLILALITTLIWSCNPSRKLDKINAKHPELLAKFCKDTFPCVTSKVETFTSFDTNYIKINCAEYNYDSAFIDTIWLTHSKTQLIDKPVYIATVGKTNTIIKTVRDSAEIVYCNLELIALNKRCAQYIEDNRILSNKVSAKNRWLMWLIIALLCSIIGNILQLKK